MQIGSNQAALTDSNGHFELSGLPEMQINIAVRKPGFFSEQEVNPGMRVNSQGMVTVGPGMMPITLKLTPEAVVFGQVEAGGEPVENIPVKVIWSNISKGRTNWQETVAITDDEGSFRIPNLLPGTYYVVAGPSLDARTVAIAGPDAQVGYPATFYPGVAEMSEAAPVKLMPGQQTQADFSLKKMRAFHISGIVTGNPPDAGVGLEFKDHSGEGFSFPMRFDPRTQKFSTNMLAGSYFIHAHSQSPDGLALSAERAVTVDSDRDGIDLALAPLPSIPIIVHMESSQSEAQPESLPLRRFRINPGGLMNALPVNVNLESIAATMNRRNYWASQEENSKVPALAIRGVEPGRYNVQINPNYPWYVQSATCGITDLLREDLEVSAHQPPIEIVLHNDSAGLNGTIRLEGRPVPGAGLLVRDGAPRQTKVVVAGDGGAFSLIGLAPGNYSLLAFDQAEGIEYSDPEVLNKYLPKATRLVLQPNQNLDTTVDLIETEK